MIDFHIRIHTGEDGLDVASALRRAALAGLRFAGLLMPSDGDFAPVLAAAEHVRRLSLYAGIEAVVGVELRHVPPALLPGAVQEARRAGIALIAVYGESIVDQVAEGTNFAAAEAGADLLLHPGLIDEETAQLAAEKGVALELTASPGHGLTNARVAALGVHAGCLLVRGSGASSARELPRRSFWPLVVRGAAWSLDGQAQKTLETVLRESEEALIRRVMAKG